jgi:hypothetical protein
MSGKAMRFVLLIVGWLAALNPSWPASAQCRIGDHVEAKGIITSDPDNNAWQINPELHEYMLYGTDFTCMR